MSSVEQTFEIWKCKLTRQRQEVLVPKSDRVHVDPEEYATADGKARFVIWLQTTDDERSRATDNKGGKRKIAKGSGVAIGLQEVLTAAHNLRGPSQNDERIHRAASIEVRLGYHKDGASTPTTLETRYATWCAVPRSWTKDKEKIHRDMGLIKLDSPFEHLVPAGFKTPPLGPLEVRVLGYPGENKSQVRDSCAHPVGSGCMYGVTGAASHNGRTKMVEYALSTVRGNSGGPVHLVEDPRTVIATHQGGDPTKLYGNVATPVDEDFVNVGRSLFENPPTAETLEPYFVTMLRKHGSWSLVSKKTKSASVRSRVSSTASRKSKKSKKSKRHTKEARQRCTDSDIADYEPIYNVGYVKVPDIKEKELEDEDYDVILPSDIVDDPGQSRLTNIYNLLSEAFDALGPIEKKTWRRKR